MDESFWHERWQTNQIPFHQPAANGLLTRHLAVLSLPAGAHIFVPLCGKSLDMHWLLAQGYRVTGIELSEIAITQLFSELGITPQTTTVGTLQRHQAGNLVIFTGNIFDLTREALGAVDAVYDRAALVALPVPLRDRYAAHLMDVTQNAAQLLITFEYDQACTDGPPFSLVPDEVHRHYDAAYEVIHLERRDIPEGLRGCAAQESVWHLQPR